MVSTRSKMVRAKEARPRTSSPDIAAILEAQMKMQ